MYCACSHYSVPQPLHMGNRNCTDTPGNTISIFIVKKRKYVSDCVTIEAYLQSRQGYLDGQEIWRKKNKQSIRQSAES